MNLRVLAMALKPYLEILKLVWPLALGMVNTALMQSVDRAFLAREAAKAMPLHLAFKKIPFVEDGALIKPTEPNGYKFEKFIFDILPNAKRAAFLAFEPKDEFSPVKNAEGSDSPATCQADLQAKWAKWLAAIGVKMPKGLPIEIDPVYALDATDLQKVGLALGAE